MIVGTRGLLLAVALGCAVFAGLGQANAQPPTEQFNYPSTGFPPWTPSSGIPRIREKPRPDTERLLLDASEALQLDGREEEAITLLKMVLKVRHERTSSWSYVFNSQHEACMQLSEIYERHGERSKALQFAILARDNYPFSDWCGVVVSGRRRDLGERIASLSEQVHKDATAGRTEDRTPTANQRPSVRR